MAEMPYFSRDELYHYTYAILEEYRIEKTFQRTEKRGHQEDPSRK
ncbi:MAG: hypothetical protein ACFFAN_10080 [Promethearchaeota archaeon]